MTEPADAPAPTDADFQAWFGMPKRQVMHLFATEGLTSLLAAGEAWDRAREEAELAPLEVP